MMRHNWCGVKLPEVEKEEKDARGISPLGKLKHAIPGKKDLRAMNEDQEEHLSDR